MASAEYQREWRKRNKGKSHAYYKKYDSINRLQDPLHFIKKILRERKRHCKANGIPFDLSIDDVKDVPIFCPVLGLELKAGTGRNSPNSPSLDRTIPHLGYVKGNVAWMSLRANRLKSDGTMEEHLKIVEYLNGVQSS